MKGYYKHLFLNRFARYTYGPLLKRRLNFNYDKISPKHRPFILVCNHVCNYDAILIGYSTTDVLYYVASDHLFRMGLLGKLLMWAMSPIPRAKSTTDAKTVTEIFRRLKDGKNVCIFPEGNASFAGESGFIPPSIGKLAKRTGASLITYNLKGGYFTLPRWSHNVRKGAIRGVLVHEYTPDELSGMTDEQMNEAIKRDLYVNAYEDQAINPVSYNGDRLAENLENTLYCCPNCLKYSSYISRGDRFSCYCGVDLRYTPFGYFEPYNSDSPTVPFTTILDWFRWQKHTISNHAAVYASDNKYLSSPIFSDEDQTLILTERARKTVPIATGRADFYNDRFTVTAPGELPITFNFTDISQMSCLMANRLAFTTTTGATYELQTLKPRSAVKYMDFYRFIMKKPENV